MTTLTAPPCRLRRMRETDHAHVYSSWLSSYEGAPLAMAMATTSWSYYVGHHKVIEQILARALGVVACDLEDDDAILGWCVYEPETLHYVFVKGGFRGAKLGTALVQHALGETCDERPIVYTHRSLALLRLSWPQPDKVTGIVPPAKLKFPFAWVYRFYEVNGPVRRHNRNSPPVERQSA